MQGSFTALITPFTSEGEIDLPMVEELVQRHIDAKSDGLILCGSTGEDSTLTLEEKISIFKRAKETAGDRLILIGTTGTNKTDQSVFLTQKAKEIGLSGCIAIVPYLSKPTFVGCLAHFSAIDAVGLPWILYHHPGRTGIAFSFEEIRQLSDLTHLFAIKDCSADFVLAQEVIGKTDLAFFSGDDTLAFAHLAIGASGLISVTGNVVPEEWNAFVHRALEKDLFGAKQLYQKLFPLCQSLVLETNPQGVKYAAAKRGLCEPILRLPLVLPSAATREAIDQKLQKFSRLLNQLS